MQRRIATRAIIVREGKPLAVKLNAYRNAIKGEFWCTIGGGVDENESLTDAITREVIEETGVTPVVGRLLFVQQFAEPAKDMEHLEFFFEVTNATDFENIDLEKTTHGVEEIKEISFINAANENLLPTFLQEIDYSNLPDQTQFYSYL